MSTINGKIFPNTSFPNAIQELPTFKDLSPEYQEAYMQYLNYILQGNVVMAQAMQEQIDPESLITANALNTLADTIGAIQAVYSSTTDYTDILHQLQEEWEAKEKSIKFVGDYLNSNNKGAWNSTTIYSKDNIVTYDNKVWLAKVNSSGKTPSAGSSYWEETFVKGNVVRVKYNNTATNPAGLDIPNDSEVMYIALNDITSTASPLVNPDWKLLTVVGTKGDNGVGFTWSGQWNSSTNYNAGNLVIYNEVAYSAITSNSGRNPETFPSFWKKEFSIDTASIPVQIEEPTNIKENGLWFKPIG